MGVQLAEIDSDTDTEGTHEKADRPVCPNPSVPLCRRERKCPKLTLASITHRAEWIPGLAETVILWNNSQIPTFCNSSEHGKYSDLKKALF